MAVVHLTEINGINNFSPMNSLKFFLAIPRIKKTLFRHRIFTCPPILLIMSAMMFPVCGFALPELSGAPLFSSSSLEYQLSSSAKERTCVLMITTFRTVFQNTRKLSETTVSSYRNLLLAGCPFAAVEFS